jgi:hypothetical protein
MLKAAKAYDGVTLVADYSATKTITTISNGVPVTGISAPTGGERYYRIDVPDKQQKFEIRISGGTGDADLYIQRNELPTTTEYDYRPNLLGNNEAVTINDPILGPWFIMIRAHQAFAGVTLLATYGGTTPETIVTLQNGVPVTGISGSADGEKHFKITVPSGQAKLDLVMSGGTGDADLYVRRGSKATTTEWDYRPYLIGNNESVSIDSPAADTYYIMIRGYSAFDGVTLKATYAPVPEQVTALMNGVAVTGLSGASGSQKFYKIDVPADQDYLTFETSGGTGDVDLYVKKGSKPSLTSWDYRPYLIGNDEKVEIEKPAAATWYVMLRGYQAYTGVTLTATYGGKTPPSQSGNNFASDTDCVAAWRFESGTLTLDSVKTNNLVNQSVTADTVNYREGAASASFHLATGWDDRNYLSIADADLTSQFPGKSGTTNKRFSICFWVKLDSIPNSMNEWPLVTKANWGAGTTCYAITCVEGGKIALYVGTAGGTIGGWMDSGVGLAIGRWYHVAATFDNVSHTGTITVWDDAADALLGPVATMTSFPAMDVNADAFMIGGIEGMWYKSLPGLLDEVVVFKDILTTTDLANIRAGTYGKTK